MEAVNVTRIKRMSLLVRLMFLDFKNPNAMLLNRISIKGDRMNCTMWAKHKEKEVKNTFRIDELNSDNEYLFVDVDGICTVIIKRDEEGVAVDIYPLAVADEPLVSTWVTNNELYEANE
jgi:hypothetical protein